MCNANIQANKDLFKQTYITKSNYLNFHLFVNIEWLKRFVCNPQIRTWMGVK